jgi:peroxisome-assembly ATPase
MYGSILSARRVFAASVYAGGCRHSQALSSSRRRRYVTFPSRRLWIQHHHYRLPWSNRTTDTTIASAHYCSKRTISTLEALRQQVESGVLQSDPAQERVAKRLARLEQALVGYDNGILFQEEEQEQQEKEENGRDNTKDDSIDPTNATYDSLPSPSNAATLNEEESQSKEPSPPPLRIPRGLYIHGPVGTGKSMLMDSFYDNAPVDKKQRFHFHNFLSQVHTRIHHLKQEDLREKGRNFSVDTRLENNPIHRVGKQIASQLSLLCLDEFQVTDIADAVILSQLFSVLFTYGTVVVATSNRPPQDLYEGGLNRSYFLPFIDLLEQHCIVHHIPSQRDYRRILSNCSSFFVNDSKEMERMVDELAMDLSDDQDGSKPLITFKSLELPVGFQRSISVSRVYGGVTSVDESGNTFKSPIMACLSFNELCDTDRGAMDYRAVANAFDIVVVENIPTLDVEGHNRARRFITLIDELYEAKCALMCSAMEAGTPMDLFRRTEKAADHVTDKQSPTAQSSRAQEILWVDVAQEGGTPVGALASVRELAFAFERASSRIFEMCSRSWWDRVLTTKYN